MKRTRQASVIVFLALSAVAATSRLAIAQESGARTVEGVWAMSLTLRDCASGAALGPPFSFAADVSHERHVE